MGKTKSRKKAISKRTFKKKTGNKKYGGVSRRQMQQIEDWKYNMSGPYRAQWEKMSYNEQYKAMRHSQKKQNRENLKDLQWANTPGFEKKQIEQTHKDNLTRMRGIHFDKTSDVYKDFMFVKNKVWLYPYLTYLTTQNPKLLNSKIEDCIDNSIDVLNRVFRQNTYFSNQRLNTNYRKEWIDCSKQSAKYMNCRISKGFNNLWIPKALKYNPHVENLYTKNINIVNNFYSLSDLAGMSYTFLVYLPKISETFRLIEAAHKLYYDAPQEQKPNPESLFTNLQYIDYCRDRDLKVNECDFLKSLILNDVTPEVENLLNTYGHQ